VLFFSCELEVSSLVLARSSDRPRTSWPDYISDLPWCRLRVEPAELSEIAVDREVFQAFLGRLPPRPYPEAKRACE